LGKVVLFDKAAAFFGIFYFLVKDHMKEIEMVLLSGTLQTGTPSTQALLRCELGVFVVWDERLATISAGNYPGLFEVEAIQPQSLPSDDGTIRLGVAAVLKRFSLTLLEQPKKTTVKKSRQPLVNSEQCTLFAEEDDSAALRSQPDEVSDHTGENRPKSASVSVLDTDRTVEIVTLPLVDQDGSTTLEVASVPQQELDAAEGVMTITAEDQALLGEQFELLATIQLDATESREKLRQQRDRLKQLGYRLNAEQVWERGE
jgi:hypothetical protein